MPDIRVIFNPAAGRGTAARLLPDVERCLDAEGADYDLVLTEAPNHARELARQALRDGYETIVSAGGDGTMNEVLNGMFDYSNGERVGTLSLMPFGSGNDFSIGLDLPQDLESACHRAIHGERRLIDVGRLGDLYFANGAGAGFDAAVNVESRRFKRVRGALMYLLAVFWTIAVYYRAPRVTVEFDGQRVSYPMLMVSVMNGRRLGGAFWMTPKAKVDDARFSLIFARKMGRPRMIRLVIEFMRGTHERHAEIASAQARRLVLTTDEPLAAHADGEIYSTGSTRYEFELLPSHLWVKV